MIVTDLPQIWRNNGHDHEAGIERRAGTGQAGLGGPPAGLRAAREDLPDAV
jgi:hypothetical protein